MNKLAEKLRGKGKWVAGLLTLGPIVALMLWAGAGMDMLLSLAFAAYVLGILSIGFRIDEGYWPWE